MTKYKELKTSSLAINVYKVSIFQNGNIGPKKGEKNKLVKHTLGMKIQSCLITVMPSVPKSS